MKIGFVLNRPLGLKVNVGDVYPIFPKFFINNGYVILPAELNGRIVVQLGSTGSSLEQSVRAGVALIFFDSDEKISIKLIKSYSTYMKVGIILGNKKTRYSMVKEYLRWVKHDFITDIAFPLQFGKGTGEEIWRGDARISLIEHLILERKFNRNKHYHLYGVVNPLELSTYRNVFTNVIFSRFDYAFTVSCLVNSIYGMDFSKSKGIFYKPVDDRVDIERSCLGLDTYFDYELDSEQRRKFFSNCDIMNDLLRMKLTGDVNEV